ncbi:MAG TPA: hypothetical protein PKN95_08760 [Verrucomicrobiota bacterium]|nr:hypothetical protein [Verrucomicrobiota bacterium]HNT15743.1 hypothetical protein [Verrucomicrobiota bacterium]
MRTKTILAAAAFIAAGALYSTAQSNVYSLNIVGYVNVDLTANQYALLSNPLKPSDGNYDVSNIVKLADGSSDSSQCLTWSGTAWESIDWLDGVGWSEPKNIALGQGFFVRATSNQTITFVGEVQTGTSSTTLSPGLSLVGSKVPVAGNYPGSTVGNDSDAIFVWAGSAWDTIDYIGGLGWTSADPNGPAIGVAQGFFYNNTGAALNWEVTLNP